MLLQFYLSRLNPSLLSLARKFSSRKMDNKLLWVDCEMTGLDVNKHKLLEVAIVISDSKFNIIDALNPIHIKASQEELDSMNDWCKINFAKNGLADACLKSNITMEDADQILHDFISKNKIKNGILAGNSIATDREFIKKFCPKFESTLHYRMVDVSAIKVLVRMWYGDKSLWNKSTEHRALSDIYASMDELKYYQANYFKKL